MAFALSLQPKHLVTGEWEINFSAATSNTYTLNDCVLTSISEFSIGANSDLDESFSMPPNVDIEFQIRPSTESNLNLVHNVFTNYVTEVSIEKDGVVYFEGIIDGNSVEQNPYDYTISCSIIWASTKIKSLAAKDNPMSFNISATAPQSNIYFTSYYFDKFFEVQNLSPQYDTLECDSDLVGRYGDGEGGWYYATITGYNNGSFSSSLAHNNKFWFDGGTNYAVESPVQLGDSIKSLAKHYGLIFTVGLSDKYYLQSRWKVTKTPVSITREQTIEHYTRTIIGKEGFAIRYWTWNSGTNVYDLTDTNTYGIVTYTNAGTIDNATGVELIDIYKWYYGASYNGSYPSDMRYVDYTEINSFEIGGSSTWDAFHNVAGDLIWTNISANRRNAVVTVDGIDWDFMDYFTLEREQNNYTYRVRQMKINVEKNQTELDLIQIF